MRQTLCSMKAPMIPSIRGLGNLPLRVPHEEIETRGEEGTQVQRREGEKEFERKKLLEFLLCPLQVSYSFYNGGPMLNHLRLAVIAKP